RGDGQLANPVSTTIAASYPAATTLALADLNGDGKLDVVAGLPFSGIVQTYRGNGAGSFQLVQSTMVGSRVSSPVVGDFNGDGRPDVAVLDALTNAVGVLLGNGDGSLQSPLLTPIGNGAGALATGDFNGDGRLDLAVGGVDNVQLLINSGIW